MSAICECDIEDTTCLACLHDGCPLCVLVAKMYIVTFPTATTPCADCTPFLDRMYRSVGIEPTDYVFPNANYGCQTCTLRKDAIVMSGE